MNVWIGELQTIFKIVPSCPDRYVISKYVFYKKMEKQKITLPTKTQIFLWTYGLVKGMKGPKNSFQDVSISTLSGVIK